MDSETKELVEMLLHFEGSDYLGDGDFSVCKSAADLITTQAAHIEELQATQLGMHDYVVQQTKRIEELIGLVKSAYEEGIYTGPDGGQNMDNCWPDSDTFIALSRLKQEVA
jgi:hypothetical protein